MFPGWQTWSMDIMITVARILAASASLRLASISTSPVWLWLFVLFSPTSLCLPERRSLTYESSRCHRKCASLTSHAHSTVMPRRLRFCQSLIACTSGPPLSPARGGSAPRRGAHRDAHWQTGPECASHAGSATAVPSSRESESRWRCRGHSGCRRRALERTFRHGRGHDCGISPSRNTHPRHGIARDATVTSWTPTPSSSENRS